MQKVDCKLILEPALNTKGSAGCGAEALVFVLSLIFFFFLIFPEPQFPPYK